MRVHRPDSFQSHYASHSNPRIPILVGLSCGRCSRNSSWSSCRQRPLRTLAPAHPPNRAAHDASGQSRTSLCPWVQFFAALTSVMSTAHPRVVPELLAYLIFILRANQDLTRGRGRGLPWLFTMQPADSRQSSWAANNGQRSMHP